MRFALSTNWNNGRLDDGAAIADEAIALGFDALELGFRTMPEQIAGFKSRLDRMPVDSVHAYCPVPIGAPSGHPELHQLAHPDEEERALARLLLKQTIACAVELGAKVVVTHAGYAELDGLFVNLDSSVLRRLAKGKDDKPDVTRPVYAKHLAKALSGSCCAAMNAGVGYQDALTLGLVFTPGIVELHSLCQGLTPQHRSMQRTDSQYIQRSHLFDHTLHL